jgi:diguanylate cyclase (GGDEF)-like protein
LLIVLGGLMQYRSIHLLMDSRNWVEHSQQVLSVLQEARSSMEKNIANEQLFFASGQAQYRQQQIQNQERYYLDLQRIAALVSDNPSEEAIARDLISGFDAQLNAVAASDETKPLPSRMDRRQEFLLKLDRMQANERQLLQERLELAAYRARQNILELAVLLALGGIIILSLVLALWRDSVRRRQLQREVEQSNQLLQATIREMEEKAQLAAIQAEASEELQICIEPDEAHNLAALFLAQLAPESSGALALINNSRQMVETMSTWGEAGLFPEFFSPDACCALRSGRHRWRFPKSAEMQCTHYAEDESPELCACLPLAAHGETLGVLLMQFPSREAFDFAHQHRKMIEELTETIAMAVANLNLRQKLRNQSIRDGLTGLFNRQFLQVAFERELHRAKRYHAPVAVFMLDVDHFKQLNDRYGHETGDAVLRELAMVMQKGLRSEDIVCRYGGEEFVMILPEMPPESAWERAEALRKSIEEMRVACGQNTVHKITVSIGISNFPSDGATQEALVRTADENLYRAKRGGRNCVIAEAPQIMPA